MKNNQAKCSTRTLLSGTLFLISICFSANPLYAIYQPDAISKEECTILTSLDFNGTDRKKESVTFRTALLYAAQADTKYQGCRKGISLKTAVINMKAPIVIDVKNVDGGYLIEGVNPVKDSERVLLNFESVSGDANACAITFTGGSTHNVTFKNIAISNAHGNAICFKDRTNGITLENIAVTSVDHHGVVIDETTHDVIITPGSVFSTIGGNAIQIENTSIEANITVNGTSLGLLDPDRHTDPITGTALFNRPANEAPLYFSMQSIQGEYVSSSANAHILVTQIQPQENGNYLIRGAVVDKSLTCTNAIIQLTDEELKSHMVNKVKRIQVYAVGIDSEDTSAGKSATFLTYVTKKAGCPVGDSCVLGVGEVGTAFSEASQFGGFFEFILGTRELLNQLNNTRGEDEPILNSITKIVLIPELSDGTLATSTEVKDINDISDRDTCSPQDAADPENPENPGSDTVISGQRITGRGDITITWKTVDECRFARTSGAVDPLFDSDGDGIPDQYEDADGDCEFNPQVDFSDWTKIDTDSDGIPDGAELNGVSYLDINLSRRTASDDVCKRANSTISFDPCNVDGDKTESNAAKDDSDDDSLYDYQEDRDRFFNSNRKAFLYRWKGIGGLEPIKINGARSECTEDLAADGLSLVGVSYGLYRVKRDLSAKPERLASLFGAQSDTNYVMLRLTCRNASVTRDTNFNGRKDGATETDPYKSNKIAGFGVCRGVAEVVFIPGTVIVDQNKTTCNIPCQDKDIFQGMDPIWVNIDSNEKATGLKRDENGEVLLFKKSPIDIKSACSNIDEDEIPDCVENPLGTCDSDVGTGSPLSLGVTLNPYKKDTDGDRIFDGIVARGTASDICPHDSTDTCDTEKFYESNPTLAFFIDRDGDGLSDGLEECGGATPETTWPVCKPNGRKGPIAGLEGRLTTKTDPLAVDTDGDGVDDFIEVSVWDRYTNAADQDTDNDQLPDGLEVIDYNATPSGKDYITSDGVGCETYTQIRPGQTGLVAYSVTSANRIGTDPAKKDTDEDDVDDGIEVRGTYQSSIPEANLLDDVMMMSGYDIASNPNSWDSDGDTLGDGEEYDTDGVMQFNESNPCDTDTDDDGKTDEKEDAGQRVLGGNDSQVCENGGMVNGFRDSDCDGVSDVVEEKLKTDPNDRDSDDDGLLDGQEDLNGDGQIQIQEGETEPKIADTDGDGLNDGEERSIGLKPHIGDSDGDGVVDGVELGGVLNSATGKIEGASIHNYGTGGFMDPTNPDTDGDGLCDGRSDRGSVRNGGLTGDTSCQFFEDKNNDGKRDLCEFGDKSQFCGTDPLNADSDLDGAFDLEEMTRGGNFSLSNAPSAVQGRQEGCFSIAGSSRASAPTSLFYLFGMLLLWNRWSARHVKVKETKN